MSLALYLFISLMCLLIGIFLQAAYAGCDPLTLKYIDTPDKLIPYFVKKTLSFIPGVSGFFAASILGSAIRYQFTPILIRIIKKVMKMILLILICISYYYPAFIQFPSIPSQLAFTKILSAKVLAVNQNRMRNHIRRHVAE